MSPVSATDPFSREVREAHRLWVLTGGRGGTQMIVRAIELTQVDLGDSELSGCEWHDASLVASCLERANFTGATLDGCDLRASDARESTWASAHLDRIRFVRSTMTGSSLGQARITECDFGFTNLSNSGWRRARVASSRFDSAELWGGIFEDAAFIDCDFRGADLSGNDGVATVATRTVFERCDFRGARIDGLRLEQASLIGCRFYGAAGPPVMDEQSLLVAPDLSSAGDGSVILSRAALLESWKQ